MTEIQKTRFFEILSEYWTDGKPAEFDLLWRVCFKNIELEAALEICDAVKIESRYKALPVKELIARGKKALGRTRKDGNLFDCWWFDTDTGKGGAVAVPGKSEQDAYYHCVRWIKSFQVCGENHVIFIGRENYPLYLQARHDWNMKNAAGYAETHAKFAKYKIKDIVQELSGEKSTENTIGAFTADEFPF